MQLVIDTNIVLLDAYNLINIAQAGNYTSVIIPETVIDEADSKKSGFSEVAYQARQFARLLAKATRVSSDTNGLLTTTILTLDDVNIHIVSCSSYPQFADDETSIRNDRKILHIAELLNRRSADVVFCSNDVMCRLRAESLGLATIDYKLVNDTEPQFTRRLTVPSDVFDSLHNAHILEVDPDYVPEFYNYVFIDESTGRVKLANLRNTFISILGKDTEDELRRQDVPPANAGQLFMSRAIQDPTVDIIVAEAAAGTGKTVTAISNAIQLVKKGKYKSITYIRTSIDDVEKAEEIGFLAGNNEKVAVYLHALEDTLQFIIRSNHKDSKLRGQEYEDMIFEKVEKLKRDCSITGMITLGMRGRTFSDTVAIIDECQNMSKSALQKVLTRFGKNCKIILIGSNKQIDNAYVTKFTNGLSVILDACRNTHDNIRLHAVSLNKVLRSPLAEWSERIFSSKS